MSELEGLPSWAGRSTQETRTGPDDDPDATVIGVPDAPPPDGPPIVADGPVAEPPVLEQPDPQPLAQRPASSTPQISAQPAADQTTPQAPDQPAADQTTPQAPDQPAAGQTTVAPTGSGPLAPSAPAERVLEPQPAPETPPGGGRSVFRTLLLALVALAVLIGAGYGGYLLADSRNDGDATAATDTTDPSDPSTDVTGDASTDAAAADAKGEVDASGGSDDATTVATGGGAADRQADEAETVTLDVDVQGNDAGATESDATVDEPMNDGNRQAFFRGGKVYLTGAVPSQEIAELIVTKAAEVVGPDNVVNEYTIDPSVTINPGDSAPLYVEDVILFEFNSIEVAQPFLPILDLGVLLLRQNPQATITVVTRTDAIGSESTNMEVARARAQAVIDYWIGQGVDPDQIEADPRGEEGASEDDDPETAAKQRRAEFIITGLLD